MLRIEIATFWKGARMPVTPLVSVITATYNMGRYLGDTLDSILGQTHQHIEAVVVDDGSTDEDTPRVLERYTDDPRVVVIRQDNAGQTVAKNNGLRHARGEFIGFCDADDLWRPDKIAWQLPLFDGRDDLGVVYGDFQFIDGEGTPIETVRPRTHSGRITGPLLADNFIHFPTTLTRHSVLDEFGGFDESLSMAIDYDLWLRISTKYEFAFVPRILVDYRIWSGQMSHRTGERLDNAFRMMRTFLAEHPDACTASEVRTAWAHTYVTRAIWHAREGRNSAALTDFARGLLRDPLSRRSWWALSAWPRRRL